MMIPLEWILISKGVGLICAIIVVVVATLIRQSRDGRRQAEIEEFLGNRGTPKIIPYIDIPAVAEREDYVNKVISASGRDCDYQGKRCDYVITFDEFYDNWIVELDRCVSFTPTGFIYERSLRIGFATQHDADCYRQWWVDQVLCADPQWQEGSKNMAVLNLIHRVNNNLMKTTI